MIHETIDLKLSDVQTLAGETVRCELEAVLTGARVTRTFVGAIVLAVVGLTRQTLVGIGARKTVVCELIS